MICKEKILDKEIYINSVNSNFSLKKEDLEKDYYSLNFDLIKYQLENYQTSFATFCINLSNACNLKCDYCFNNSKDGKSMDLDTIKTFLDTCFKSFPYKDKYFVDVSGKGEPLLFLDKILKIKEYCINISNRIGKEVLVSFVSNGTLLSTEIASVLQKNGILFGVSLDGNEYVHNLHRKTNKGEDTYQTIINNVKNIEHHEYVGAATTLTKDVFSLVDSVKELSEVFNTLGYKPARNCEHAFDNESIDKWLVEYDKLTLFLLNECMKNNDKYIKVLLNGDDYFGKFIKRVMTGVKAHLRCDGGLSRVSLDDDGKVYICPSAFGNESFVIGDVNNIEREKQRKIFDEQISKLNCYSCPVKYICGGECLIEKRLVNGNNFLMCKYKKHLILLSMYFAINLVENNYPMFVHLSNFSRSTFVRYQKDRELEEFLQEHPEYSFVEGKEIFDNLYKKY